MIRTDYDIRALRLLLCRDCLPERYYPLLPFAASLTEGLTARGCKAKNAAASLPGEELAAIAPMDEVTLRLFRRFLSMYDPDPKKFRELEKLALPPEEKEAFRALYHLPGVKQTRASLYLAAGYSSLEEFASTSVDQVRERTARVIAEKGLGVTVPLPKEVRTQIAVAKAFTGQID